MATKFPTKAMGDEFKSIYVLIESFASKIVREKAFKDALQATYYPESSIN